MENFHPHHFNTISIQVYIISQGVLGPAHNMYEANMNGRGRLKVESVKTGSLYFFGVRPKRQKEDRSKE